VKWREAERAVIDRDRRRVLAILGGMAASLPAVTAVRAGDGEPPVRIAVLKFGTVSWMLDVLRRHRFDRAEGVEIEIVELASGQATQVALQAGRVDTIVGDLLWVARQRASGADWAFIPYSAALGAVEVAADSLIRTLEDLPGKRLGIAGTPLDKSWLLLRLLSLRRFGRDFDSSVEKIFGAPPLLAEQFAAGRLDAVLTYWQFAARLEAKGARRLLGMDEVMRDLGIAERVALVGYIVSEHWAQTNRPRLVAFLKACRRAEDVLARSDEEWRVIAPRTGAASDGELARLRDEFRAGIPERDRNTEEDAARLYALLVGIGGETVAGPSTTLPAGTILGGFGS
jgi:NitT/TauT family transport system substrate-binding protein